MDNKQLPFTQKVFILDTNVLLNDPNSLGSFGRNKVVIPIYVLEELDKFKRDSGELGRNSRIVSRKLDEMSLLGDLSKGIQFPHGGVLQVQLIRKSLPKKSAALNKEVDNRILAVALEEMQLNPKTTLITRDINLRIRARALGLLSEKMGVDITKHQSLSEVDDSGVIEFNLSKLVEDLPEPIDDYSFSESGKAFVFKNFSLQPSISRDVSVWLPSRDSKPELEEILSGLELSVREPRMIDEFEKEGRVSYLYRLVFQADDRTLTDEEINAVMGPVYEEINSKGDWELR